MSAPGARVWIASFGALLACAGCGFKGPLYLPERNATVITHPGQPGQATTSTPGQTPTPAAKKKNETSQQSNSPPPQSSPPPPPQ